MYESVARTKIGPVVISTVELDRSEEPDKYETMIFYGESDILDAYQARSGTEEQAFADHIEAIQFYIQADLWV
jgi:hypothetical protein